MEEVTDKYKITPERAKKHRKETKRNFLYSIFCKLSEYSEEHLATAGKIADRIIPVHEETKKSIASCESSLNFLFSEAAADLPRNKALRLAENDIQEVLWVMDKLANDIKEFKEVMKKGTEEFHMTHQLKIVLFGKSMQEDLASLNEKENKIVNPTFKKVEEISEELAEKTKKFTDRLKEVRKMREL